MRIVCPSCTAAYDVPDTRLPASGRVRCARCAHEWSVAPPDVPSRAALIPEPEIKSAPAPTLAPIPPAEPPPRPWPALLVPTAEPTRNRAAGAAWTVSLLVLVVLAVAAYAYRVDIMRMWPPSARAYQLFGL
jgi:predicted Zn finger-like uncharacterized protein